MRLTCPNCSAVYEIEAGLIPGGGSHVQCSACQTRWFERETVPPRLSEDQIITRLETRPRPTPVQTARLAPEPVAFRPTPRPVAPSLAAAPVKPQPEPVVTPLRRRAGSERPAPAANRPAPQIQRRNRFGWGFGLALAIVGAGLAAYWRADDLAGRLPVGAPALEAYAARIDAERERLEARLGPLRDQALRTIFPEG